MKKKIGVVIGRFQTPDLGSILVGNEHEDIISVLEREQDEVYVVIRDHGGIPNNLYPLDSLSCTIMVSKIVPHKNIFVLRDTINPESWSKKLDELLLKNFNEEDAITLYEYCSGDLEGYSGKFLVQKSDTSPFPFEEYTVTPSDSTEFRRGVIYASLKRFPIMFACADIVPYDIQDGKLLILVGERSTEGGKYRFFGGFADPQLDSSYDETAIRERSEEALGIKIYEPKYVCSMKIDNHRFRGSKDALMTTLFVARYISGEATPGDDIDFVHWVPLLELEDKLVPEHLPLFKKVKEKLTV